MESEPISHAKALCQEDKKVLSTLQFEDLPNEVVDQVFSYLKIKDLLRCGQVSKRFRAISSDESVWPKKFNLCYKKVPVGFLQKLLESGCKYLSLSGAISKGTLNLPRASRLLYLNLSGFPIIENSEKLLKSCYSLQKLSLSYFHFPSKLISIASLQNGKTLRVLDLSNCILCICISRNTKDWSCTQTHCAYPTSIQQIVENCTELKELSLHKTKLCKRSVDFLCFNLTSKVEKLDLYDLTFLRDEHVKKIVTRCNKITELDLGGWSTSITVQSLSFIIEHLQLTLVKLNLKHSYIYFDSSYFLKLKSMEKLTHLCYENNNVVRLPIAPNTDKPIIARPLNLEYYQGCWEIKVEREELFRNIHDEVGHI